MRVLAFIAIVFMCGCASSPDMSVGWLDSYIRVGNFIVDGECLIDKDYDALEEVCPECVQKRWNERDAEPPAEEYDLQYY